MNGALAHKLPNTTTFSPKTIAFLLLALMFAILLGWAARSILTMQPVTVVPCRSCSQKCPCPRLTGAIRCGCPE